MSATPSLAQVRWNSLSKSLTSLPLPSSNKLDFPRIALSLSIPFQGTKEMEERGFIPIKMCMEHFPELLMNDHNGTSYLSIEERDKYLTKIVQNTLYRNGNVYTTSGKEHIFVIGTSELLFFVGEPNYFPKSSSKKFHHSSFLSGRPVICAGEIKTNDTGKIIEVTDRSGHYKPCLKAFKQGLNVLRNQYGMDLSQVAIKAHFGKNTKKQILHPGNGFYKNGHDFFISQVIGRLIPDRVSSYVSFHVSTMKITTEEGFITGKRDYRGVITKLSHKQPPNPIVDLRDFRYGLSPSQIEIIILKACLNSLKKYQSCGLDLSQVIYKHVWSQSKETSIAADFLNKYWNNLPEPNALASRSSMDYDRLTDETNYLV